MFSIAIILFDDFEELDAIGPWEVFRMAEEASGDKISCEMARWAVRAAGL